MAKKWQGQLFEQKNLWQVSLKSRKVLPRSSKHKAIMTLATVALVAIGGFAVWAGSKQYLALSDQAAFVILMADTGLIFSLGVLGFLIAGFAIFASVTKPMLFIMLAKIPYKDGQINRLQFVFFNFLSAFISYLTLLALSLVVKIAFADVSPMSLLGSIIVSEHPLAGYITNSFATVLFGLLLVSSFLRLKSFIWNLYQTVLFAVVTEEELRESSQASAADAGAAL